VRTTANIGLSFLIEFRFPHASQALAQWASRGKAGRLWQPPNCVNRRAARDALWFWGNSNASEM